MTVYHKNLEGGGWKKLSFVEKMANIGSEVERAINWKSKNKHYADLAIERFLELIDLTILDETEFHRLRELLRIRELFLDYILGNNQYLFPADFWKKYFYQFTYASSANK